MKRKFRFLFVLVPIAFITVAIFVTMGLWNWLMPALFGLGTLTFIQAGGIFILTKILFGHKGHHGWHGHHMRFAHAGGSCGPNAGFRNHFMAHHWQKLTPEQREKYAGKYGCHGFHENEETSIQEKQ
jgi:hypothetical protein